MIEEEKALARGAHQPKPSRGIMWKSVPCDPEY